MEKQLLNQQKLRARDRVLTGRASACACAMRIFDGEVSSCVCVCGPDVVGSNCIRYDPS